MGNKIAASGASALHASDASTSGTSKVEGCADKASVIQSIQSAIYALDFYNSRGYKITHVKRGQNPLGEQDWYYLHGYVVLKLEKSTEPTDTKFARLDWCREGMVYQVAHSEAELTKYLGDLMEDIKQAKGRVIKQAAEDGAKTVGGTTCVFVVGECISIGASSAGGAATVGFAAAAGAVIAGALVVGLGITALGAKISQNCETFEKVKDTDQALARLIHYLTEEQEDPRLYSVTVCNCNHFADEVRLKVMA